MTLKRGSLVLSLVLLTSSAARGASAQDAQAGDAKPGAASLPGNPAPPAQGASDAPPSLGSPRHVPALVAGGLAVVALGTGAVFGVLAWQDHEDFQSRPRAELATRGESRGLTADMCFGGAATLAVASLVMLFAHPSEAPTRAPEPAAHVGVAPFVTPQGAGAAAVVRF